MSKINARVSGTIKALEWLDHPSGSKCLTDDHYSIALWANERPHPLYVRKYTTMRRSKTLEAAKAAAQADYESCILAAIQPYPEPQPVAWRWRLKEREWGWEYQDDEPSSPNLCHFDVQPLYATPPSAGTVSVEAAAGVLLEAKLKCMYEGGGSKYLSYIDGVALRALAGDHP